MRQFCLAFGLLLTPLAAARADEIDGLNSPAIDISNSFQATRAADPQYGAAFAAANGIIVQSRYTEGTVGAVACTAVVALPAGARQVSHPALSTSGWLFVAATANRLRGSRHGWHLYATQRLPRIGEAPLGHCGGWNRGWQDLGDADGASAASAPDAVVAYDLFTLVFVTTANARIAYRIFDSTDRTTDHPTGAWRAWQTLRATDPATTGYSLAESKPAVAIYNPSPHPDVGINYLHVFWLDPDLRQVHHVRGLISWNGGFSEYGQTPRALEDSAGAGVVARTACSAGPEVKAPSFLFIVCGVARGVQDMGYSIARFRNPDLPWSSSGAVETIDGKAWISRSAYGGTSAPSLGRTGGLAGVPLMFITYGEQFCPPLVRPRQPTLPGPQCGQPGPWAIQNRFVRPLRLNTDSVADWRSAGAGSPLR